MALKVFLQVWLSVHVSFAATWSKYAIGSPKFTCRRVGMGEREAEKSGGRDAACAGPLRGQARGAACFLRDGRHLEACRFQPAVSVCGDCVIRAQLRRRGAPRQDDGWGGGMEGGEEAGCPGWSLWGQCTRMRNTRRTAAPPHFTAGPQRSAEHPRRQWCLPPSCCASSAGCSPEEDGEYVSHYRQDRKRWAMCGDTPRNLTA